MSLFDGLCEHATNLMPANPAMAEYLRSVAIKIRDCEGIWREAMLFHGVPADMVKRIVKRVQEETKP